MSRQPDDVREDKSKVPAVSVQPVGNPVPVTVENAKLEKLDSAGVGSGARNKQNSSNTGDKE